MSACFVADAVRTPIGKLRGALKDARPDDLLALVVGEVLRSAPASRARRSTSSTRAARTRRAKTTATWRAWRCCWPGLPDAVPAATVNRLCGSGLEAIIQGARQIRLGEADIVIAGGVESMTRAPWSTPKPSEAFPGGKLESWDTSLGWRYPNPKLAARFPLEGMGETAENVAERLKISREDQDRFALASHQKAVRAQQSGAFAAELVSVELPQKKGPPLVVSQDEQPRGDSTLREALHAQGGLPRRRHGDGGQLVHPQRRRLRGGVDERARPEGLGQDPAGPLRLQRHGRRGSARDGPGPRPRHPQGARARRVEAFGGRADRAQRGLRGPVAGLPARAASSTRPGSTSTEAPSRWGTRWA